MADTEIKTVTEEIERRNVSMYSDQWAVVDEVNEQYDFRNVSTALRFVVNDYRRLKSQEVERLQPER